jgi:uncharacterized protein (DUF885 family)
MKLTQYLFGKVHYVNSVEKLAAQLLEIRFDWYPMLASALGILGRDHLLPAFSVAAESDLSARLRAVLRECSAVESSRLTRSDELTCAVIRYEASSLIDHFATGYLDYEISDSIFAPLPGLLADLETLPISGAEQAEGHLARLRAFPEFLVMLAQRHRRGLAAGRAPVARLVRAAIGNLEQRLANLHSLRRSPVAVSPGFDEQCAHLVDEVVGPALAAYREFLVTSVLPLARTDDRGGLCWLPDGEDGYAAEIRRHTTSQRSADELHRTGCDLIAALDDEYRVLGGRVFGTNNVTSVFARLRDDPSLRWQRAGDMLASARQAVRRAEAVAPRWFRSLPSVPCDVREQPATESAQTPPYYRIGTLDGSSPGTYFVNTKQPERTPRYWSESLAFHEGVPGHHFESTSASLRTELPPLRTIIPISAFVEGWGVYAERLADEMGLYSGDLDRLGMLSDVS